MVKKSGLIALMIFIYFQASGQEKISALEADRISYEYLIAADWDNLIEFGKDALRQGIDFYYLQYRLGIAWYQKKNYRKASDHFYNAWNINHTDPILNEYLYYSLIFSGRPLQADYHAKAELQKKGINRVELYLNRNITEKNTTLNYDPADDPEADGSRLIGNGHTWFMASVSHSVRPGVHLTHAYTFTRASYLLTIKDENNSQVYPNAWSNLNQYLLQASIRINHHTELSTGFQYIHVSFPENFSTINQDPGIGNSRNMVKRGEYLLTAGISRHHKSVAGFLSMSYSNLNNLTQIQPNVGIAVYPKGNTKAYFLANYSHPTQKENGSWRQSNVLHSGFGIETFKNIWTEVHYYTGNMDNFIRANGFVIHNGVNRIRSMGNIRLIALAGSSVSFFIDASTVQHVSEFRTWETGAASNQMEYQSMSFTGGVIWQK